MALPRALCAVAALAAAVVPGHAVGGLSARAAALAPDAAPQIGVRLPKLRDVDFTTRQPALVAVSVDPKSDAEAKAARSKGAVKMTLSADPKTGALRVTPAEPPSGLVPVAWVAYSNTIQKTGWAYLSVKATSDKRVSNDLKMYAAGFLEGLVSAKQIRDFQHNADAGLQQADEKHHALGNIQSNFNNEIRTLCNHSNMLGDGVVLTEANAPKDQWLSQSRYALLQAWGIMDSFNRGVKDVKGKPMSLVDLVVLNSDGETPELEVAYDMEESLLRQSEREDPNDSGLNDTDFLQVGHRLRRQTAPAAPLSRRGLRGAAAARRKAELKSLDDRAWQRIRRNGHCSALVRLTNDRKDLLVGHTTFSDYSEMNRIFKYYDIPLGEGIVQKMGFSSYPGVAGSTDDYYIYDSGLVVTETTISMLTDEPYDKLDDNGTNVPDFMRIMVAGRLAKTGEDWVQLMRRSNSGTYSSQWMVVDYNKFSPGKPIQNGTLMVLEQIPGNSHSQDESMRLQKEGFWHSENRPVFPDVRKSVGYGAAEDEHGGLFSADENPRAMIFKATAPAVQTLSDMRDEMQRNKWPKEPGVGDLNIPNHAIAARGDLNDEKKTGMKPDPNGGIDSKVTNVCLVRKLACDAISGPSRSGGAQKPFKWTDANGKDLYPDDPHDGLPDLWDFDWVRFSPGGEMEKPNAADCSTL